MNAQAPVIETRDLTKRYGELTALDRVSLTVDRGRILGLIGPNGAGKTTAIKILVGLARPTGGSARIAGADCLREARTLKRLVGYMPDRFGAYDNMRVREYLDFFGAAFGIRRRERGRRIEEVLETTGTRWLQDRYVESLSHGMQQRVGIARTLLHDPQVLIFDEPASGLDPEARIEMRTLLRRLADDGKTLIVTSHVLPELSRVCDLVAILMRGRLRAFGRLEEIMRQISRERMIEVQLARSGQVERTVQTVRQFIEPDAEVTGSPAEAVVRFRTSRDEEQLADLLAALTAGGVKVTQFREVQTDLEDAFLSVTREPDESQTVPEDREPDALAGEGERGRGDARETSASM